MSYFIPCAEAFASRVHLRPHRFRPPSMRWRWGLGRSRCRRRAAVRGEGLSEVCDRVDTPDVADAGTVLSGLVRRTHVPTGLGSDSGRRHSGWTRSPALAGGRRSGRCDRRALLLQRRSHVADRQPARLHQRGIEPDAHGRLAGAEH